MIHTCAKIEQIKEVHVSKVCQCYKSDSQNLNFFSDKLEWPRFSAVSENQCSFLILHDRTVGITAEFESHALGSIINYEQRGWSMK